MRILLTNDTYYPHTNGSSYFTQRLAEDLQAKQHSIAVIAPSETFAHSKKQVNSILVYGLRSFKPFFCRYFRVAGPYFLKRQITKIIKEFQPDIIHLHGHYFISRATLQIGKKLGVPIVATNNFMPENVFAYFPILTIFKKQLKKLMWQDFAKIFNQVNQVTTPTEKAAQIIRPHLKVPVKVISCGLNLDRFKIHNNGHYLKERYQLSSGPILLFVGRLDEDKALDFVLPAVAQALQKTDFHFVIAGAGNEEDKLKTISQRLGLEKKVSFLGFVPNQDLPNLYVLADCFIIAGPVELQSIVTMEAMATGLPVIAVDSLALPELVHDGANGYLFPRGDKEALAEKLVKIFSFPELRKQMGQESLRIIAQHDIAKTIRAFEGVYQGAIAGNNN